MILLLNIIYININLKKNYFAFNNVINKKNNIKHNYIFNFE